MSGPVDLSPLGTAREAVLDANLAPLPEGAAAADQALLTWYRKIREPLKALYNLEEEIVLIAWELTRWQDGLELVERQAVMILILAVLIHLREGSTRIRLKGGAGPSVLLDLAARLLKGQDPVPPPLRLEAVQVVKIIEKLVDSKRLGTIVGSAGEFKPLVVLGPYLYLQKMLHLEDRFVAVLQRRLEAVGPEYDAAAVEHALGDVLERPALRRGQAVNLTGEQEAAVRAAVRLPMTIISGGPGTGKTTIILSILRVLRRLGVACADIALAAPTGKAANRMGEAVSAGIATIALAAPEDLDLVHLAAPRTLHRLLGYSQKTGNYLHHENNRLAERVVIIDESSMIDLAMMERLVRSLRDDSQFMLLGDAHQLPSVEAGAVLRDLLAAFAIRGHAPLLPRGIQLTQSHRMRRKTRMAATSSLFHRPSMLETNRPLPRARPTTRRSRNEAPLKSSRSRASSSSRPPMAHPSRTSFSIAGMPT